MGNLGPFQITLLSISIGVLVVALMTLAIPWIDFAVTRWRLNPFHLVERYWAWCERAQKKL